MQTVISNHFKYGTLLTGMNYVLFYLNTSVCKHIPLLVLMSFTITYTQKVWAFAGRRGMYYTINELAES
jgi:hypothetical protein